MDDDSEPETIYAGSDWTRPDPSKASLSSPKTDQPSNPPPHPASIARLFDDPILSDLSSIDGFDDEAQSPPLVAVGGPEQSVKPVPSDAITLDGSVSDLSSLDSNAFSDTNPSVTDRKQPSQRKSTTKQSMHSPNQTKRRQIRSTVASLPESKLSTQLQPSPTAISGRRRRQPVKSETPKRLGSSRADAASISTTLSTPRLSKARSSSNKHAGAIRKRRKPGRRKRLNLDSPNIKDQFGCPQLFYYIAREDFAGCQTLIQHGAQVNLKANDGTTALHEAVAFGCHQIAELLLCHGAVIDAKAGAACDTALHRASYQDDFDMVQLLLRHGADVGLRNSRGLSALDLCSDDTVAALLTEQVKMYEAVVARNKTGSTKLHRMCAAGDLDCVLDLLAYGADVNAQDYAQWTPLHEAALAGHLTIVCELLSRGANVNASGLKGVTPLHDAVSNGKHEVVRLLLDHGADPLLTDEKQRTPRDMAEDDKVLALLDGAIANRQALSNSQTAPISITASIESLLQVDPDGSPKELAGTLPTASPQRRRSRRRREGQKPTATQQLLDDVTQSKMNYYFTSHQQVSREERKFKRLLDTISRLETRSDRSTPGQRKRPKLRTRSAPKSPTPADPMPLSQKSDTVTLPQPKNEIAARATDDCSGAPANDAPAAIGKPIRMADDLPPNTVSPLPSASSKSLATPCPTALSATAEPGPASGLAASSESLFNPLQFLPLYTVSLRAADTGQHGFYVIDMQVCFLLGIPTSASLEPSNSSPVPVATNGLFARYPHLSRVLVNRVQKERLWDPLASMLTPFLAQQPADGCNVPPQAILAPYVTTKPSSCSSPGDVLSTVVLATPLDCQQDSKRQIEPSSPALSRSPPSDLSQALGTWQQQEKERFLRTTLYFVRLDDIVRVIESDYADLSRDLITLTLDIGNGESHIARSTSTIVPGLDGKPATTSSSPLDAKLVLNAPPMQLVDSRASDPALTTANPWSSPATLDSDAMRRHTSLPIPADSGCTPMARPMIPASLRNMPPKYALKLMHRQVVSPTSGAEPSSSHQPR
ncbi:hypothetical protein H4R35_004578 [Dimargaris xerosporica]|nr:hypothetical protein H4R35_004578 [Dimargaris xerosporica]